MVTIDSCRFVCGDGYVFCPKDVREVYSYLEQAKERDKKFKEVMTNQVIIYNENLEKVETLDEDGNFISDFDNWKYINILTEDALEVLDAVGRYWGCYSFELPEELGLFYFDDYAQQFILIEQALADLKDNLKQLERAKCLLESQKE